METTGYCIENDRAAQMELAEMERHNSLLIWEENKKLRARVARLEEALKRGVELHENCDADTCMCGEPMHHPLSDHKPLAMLQYYGDQWIEEAKSALEEK